MLHCKHEGISKYQETTNQNQVGDHASIAKQKEQSNNLNLK